MASLPPESRFATHALAAGATVEEIGALMQLSTERVETHLRSAARAVVGSPPPPSSGRAALLDALAPVVADVRAWQATDATPHAEDDVRLRPWADGRLDGPLLLATLEWAGDDPARLRRGLRMHRDPTLARSTSATPTRARRGCAGSLLLLGAVVAAGYALAASS